MKKTTQHNIKETLLAQGVEKLKRFGFINVTEENIISDEVYSLYFLKMLKEMFGEDPERDEAIDELLRSMDQKIK